MKKTALFFLLTSFMLAAEIAEPTIKAIKEGNLSHFEKLKNIKELAESSNSNGKTALMLAVWEQKRQIVDLFLKHGVNPNLVDKSGKTALMLAVWKEDLEMTRLLISHGADINLKNSEGLKAIDIATLSGNGEIIDYLEGLAK